MSSTPLSLEVFTSHQAFFDDLIVPVCAVDRDLNVFYGNRAYAARLPQARRRALRSGAPGETARLFDRKTLAALAERTATEPRAHFLETLAPSSADGTPAKVAGNAVALVEAAGQPAGLLISFYEVAASGASATPELEQYRTWFEQARDESQQLEAVNAVMADALGELTGINTLKNDFLRLINHEFRTPLTTILGFGQLLRGHASDSTPPAEIRHYGEIITAEVLRLRDLLENLLELTALEARRVPFSIEPTDVVELLEAALNRVEHSLEQRHVVRRLETGLPQVPADPKKLSLVLLHLLTNAVTATEPGGTISVSANLSDDREHLEVAITDDGRGLEPARFAKVFEPFRPTDSNLVLHQEHAGLGIPICKRIIEDGHGGRLWVFSPGEGQGSTFAFHLPLTIEADAAVPAATLTEPDPGEPETP